MSDHSADYILYGLDDNVLNKTKNLLDKYSDEEIEKAIHMINDIAIFIKK